MAEAEVDKVVKLRKVGFQWHVIQEHDGIEFRREAWNGFRQAKGDEEELVKLGYRIES